MPTTPVSLPYGTAVTTTYSGTAPPIRTLTQQQPPSVQVHRDHPDPQQQNSLHPQNIHQQRQPSHPGFPNIRTVSINQLHETFKKMLPLTLFLKICFLFRFPPETYLP